MTKQEIIELTKCRAKAITESRKGEWVSGYIQFFCGNLGTTNAMIHTYNKGFNESIFVDPKTVQRYIGRDDLYEDDLITIGKDPTIYCIVWDAKYLGWVYVGASDNLRKFPFTSSDFENGIKVAGNYLDNPELWQKSV